MAMIKKFLIIISMLILIIAQIGVCYADAPILESFPYNQSNGTVGSIILQPVAMEQSLTVSALYTSGYRNMFSIYSKQKVHITITINNIQLILKYQYSGSYSTEYFREYVNNYFSLGTWQTITRNTLDAENIQFTIDTFSVSGSSSSESGTCDAYVSCVGCVLQFDMPIKNTELLKSGNGSTLNYTALGFPIVDTKFTYQNCSYTMIRCYLNQYCNYTIKYDFGSTILNNVDGFIVQNRLWLYCADDGFLNAFNMPNAQYQVFCNGSTKTYTPDANMLQESWMQYNLVDNSRFNYVSIAYNRVSRDFNYFSYQFSDSYDMYLSFMIYTPLFYNNSSNFITMGDNGFFTPLHLDYYDAEWYELHYQLANAFIFLITELPIISDITNLVYSLGNIIYSALNMLLQFDGFGYLFAFGMFAIIFGLFIKLFMGGD